MLDARIHPVIARSDGATVATRVTCDPRAVARDPAAWLSWALSLRAERLHLTMPVSVLMEAPGTQLLQLVLRGVRRGGLCFELDADAVDRLDAPGVERLWAWTSVGLDLALLAGRPLSPRDVRAIARLCPAWLVVPGTAAAARLDAVLAVADAVGTRAIWGPGRDAPPTRVPWVCQPPQGQAAHTLRGLGAVADTPMVRAHGR